MQGLIDKATLLGVPTDQIPEIIRDFAGGHQFNHGAILWDRLHPDDPNLYGCCWGDTVRYWSESTPMAYTSPGFLPVSTIAAMCCAACKTPRSHAPASRRS